MLPPLPYDNDNDNDNDDNEAEEEEEDLPLAVALKDDGGDGGGDQPPLGGEDACHPAQVPVTLITGVVVVVEVML